jgi:hypothetical protein
MKLAYFPNQIALNGQIVLNAFLAGCRSLGIECVPNQQDAAAAVIWSVVWMGRMRQNRAVYEHYRSQGKPVFILEVGSLQRNITWKLAINNVNGEGIFANTDNFIQDRDKFLNLNLNPIKTQRKREILIASQHQHSQQWINMPSVDEWINQIIEEIRKYTARPIVVRPHPRSLTRMRSIGNIVVEIPRKIPGSYDNYNLAHDYHCVINWNSGVAVQSAINGCPIITGPTSLAYEVSDNIENIENISLPNREDWFKKLIHTEWLVEELAQGIPQRRLLDKL